MSYIQQANLSKTYSDISTYTLYEDDNVIMKMLMKSAPKRKKIWHTTILLTVTFLKYVWFYSRKCT